MGSSPKKSLKPWKLRRFHEKFYQRKRRTFQAKLGDRNFKRWDFIIFYARATYSTQEESYLGEQHLVSFFYRHSLVYYFETIVLPPSQWSRADRDGGSVVVFVAYCEQARGGLYSDEKTTIGNLHQLSCEHSNSAPISKGRYYFQGTSCDHFIVKKLCSCSILYMVRFPSSASWYILHP